MADLIDEAETHPRGHRMNLQGMSREDLEWMAVASRDLAKAAKGQYDAYIEAGFSTKQALELTGHFVDWSLRQAEHGADDPPLSP